MTLKFYYGSGSQPAWKVWLTLEHKGIPYELHTLSFDKKETRTPEFLAMNPRGKVPTIDHDGFVLYESSAIVEYLEGRFPEKPLLPADPGARALTRRIVAEVDNYLAPAQRALSLHTLFRPANDGDPAAISAAKEALLAELLRFEEMLTHDYLAGPELSLADFAAYPYLRTVKRVDERQPGNGLGDRFPPKLSAWMKRIEALPYYDKTIPPHWRS